MTPDNLISRATELARKERGLYHDRETANAIEELIAEIQRLRAALATLGGAVDPVDESSGIESTRGSMAHLNCDSWGYHIIMGDHCVRCGKPATSRAESEPDH